MTLKKRLGLAATLVLLTIPSFFLLQWYSCPFRYLIGFPCPGCGLTRAMMCMLALKPFEALYYHLLAWPVFIVIVGGYLTVLGCVLTGHDVQKLLRRFQLTNRQYGVCVSIVIVAWLYNIHRWG